MKLLVLCAGVFIFSVIAAEAACDAQCRARCKQSPGGVTVATCIKLWSCINEKTKGRPGNEPPPECAYLYKSK